MKKYFTMLLCAMAIVMSSCGEHTESVTSCSTNESKTKTRNSTKVYIQPYKGVPQSMVKQLKTDLENNLADYSHVDITSIEILPEIELTPDLKDGSGRYSAGKILEANNKAYRKGVITISITMADITVPKNGNPWGIRGLARLNRKGCVVSPYRCGVKNPLWKVATHEFIHTYWKRNHCPKDDPMCIMQDAKGKGNLSVSHGLCDFCKSEIGL